MEFSDKFPDQLQTSPCNLATLRFTAGVELVG